jgi:predicted porin
VKKTVLGAVLGAGLVAGPAFAQSTTTWNGLPDRFQVDAGYFGIHSDTTLRFNGGSNAGDEINFEKDLGLAQNANTFWVDGTWRVGRRHTLKLGYTHLSRERQGFQVQRDVNWGGVDFSAGLNVTPSTSSNIFSGYYRFAIYRNDRFEIGPALGIGHLSISAGLQGSLTVNTPAGSVDVPLLDRSASTGSVTGAVGAYTEGWVTKRLLAQADYLYIKVKPGDSTASVADWRIGANYYFLKNVGLGVQYKYDRYQYDRGALATELGGEIVYKGAQVFASFRF